MRHAAYFVGGFLLLVIAWFLAWHGMMADDVAQVKASIDHHHRAIKAANATTTFKADEVYATGFPFGFRVGVDRPTLTQIAGNETYAISMDRIELRKLNAQEGRYRVTAPAQLDALYSVAGQAPESYRITLSEVPALLVRAQGNSQQCPNLPGMQACPPASATAPFLSFAAQLPQQLVLDVTLRGNTKQIGFQLPRLGMPVFVTLPADASHPLQTFVGMLREAMVFQPPNH